MKLRVQVRHRRPRCVHQSGSRRPMKPRPGERLPRLSSRVHQSGSRRPMKRFGNGVSSAATTCPSIRFASADETSGSTKTRPPASLCPSIRFASADETETKRHVWDEDPRVHQSGSRRPMKHFSTRRSEQWARCPSIRFASADETWVNVLVSHPGMCPSIRFASADETKVPNPLTQGQAVSINQVRVGR